MNPPASHTPALAHGVTLLLTRPEAQARRFADEAEAALGRFDRIVVSPVLRIDPLVPRLDLPEAADLVFTSENGVRVAAQRMRPHGRRAWCVGQRTAEAAREAGFDAVSADGDADALVALLIEAAPAGDIVHLSGAHQRGDLAERLVEAGLRARRMALYLQEPRPLTGEARAVLSGTAPLLAPVFSARSATLLSAALGPELRAPLLLAALSPAVAAAWQGPAPVAQAVAERADGPAMIGAMQALLSDMSRA